MHAVTFLQLLQGTVREVLSFQLESGQAAQACVTFTHLNASGGTRAAQVQNDKVVVTGFLCTASTAMQQTE